MKVISIVNLKGGVGKTTTAVNLAAVLAADYEKRVLLIDADSQGNASEFYRIFPSSGSLTDIFEGATCDPRYFIQRTQSDGLDMIPGDLSLADLDLADEKPRSELLRKLPDFCAALERENAYDYVIIDCPPAFSIASISAIAATDEIIVPIKAGKFEALGVNKLYMQIASVQRVHKNIRIAGCLMTLWHNCDVVRQGEAWLRSNAPCPVFQTHIRRTDKADESTYAEGSLYDWSPTCAAARDYRAFAAEYLGGELGG